MAEPKTAVTNASVAGFLDAIPDRRKRSDCRALAKMMREVSGARGRMWGASIVGYGSYDYRYASGRSGSWFLCGFSPRAQNIAIYIMAGFAGREAPLARLGKHKTGKCCLYIKSLDDVDAGILRELVADSVAEMRRRYPAG